MEAGTLPLGGIGKRFFASCIDGVILWAVQWGISVLIMKYYLSDKIMAAVSKALTSGKFSNEEFLAEMLFFTWLSYLVTLAIGWLYYAVMESRSGATFGKKMLNLQVTDESGGPISFGRASARYFGKIISGLILCLGYVMAFFSPKRQALHDMLAKTLVLDGTQTFVSSYARPEVSAFTITGESPSDGSENEDIIDLNKNPLDAIANNLHDPRLHAFGEVQLPRESSHTPPPVHQAPVHTGPVDNTFGEVPPEPVFVDPRSAQPVPPPTAKKVAAPAQAVVPAPAPPPAGDSAPEKKKPPIPAGMKPCPACGAAVGAYQTKCNKCHADLKPGGMGKKLFGKIGG